MKISEKERDPL